MRAGTFGVFIDPPPHEPSLWTQADLERQQAGAHYDRGHVLKPGEMTKRPDELTPEAEQARQAVRDYASRRMPRRPKGVRAASAGAAGSHLCPSHKSPRRSPASSRGRLVGNLHNANAGVCRCATTAPIGVVDDLQLPHYLPHSCPTFAPPPCPPAGAALIMGQGGAAYGADGAATCPTIMCL